MAPATSRFIKVHSTAAAPGSQGFKPRTLQRGAVRPGWPDDVEDFLGILWSFSRLFVKTLAGKRRFNLLVSLLALMLVGSAGALAAVTMGPLFAFVLLGQGADGTTVPMVRSVMEGASACPELRSAGGALLGTMTTRARPVGGGFDAVLVCEARYPVGEAVTLVAGSEHIDLPAVRLATPRRVVLLGDTGCNGADATKPQLCTGDGFGAAWPFAALAGDAVRPPPDLIIHVGDYNYRGPSGTLVLPPAATGYARDLAVTLYDTGAGDASAALGGREGREG